VLEDFVRGSACAAAVDVGCAGLLEEGCCVLTDVGPPASCSVSD
jgi:hypothetical protein